LTVLQNDPATAASAPSPDARATEFKAVEGGGEHRSGEVLLVEAYSVLWLILIGWIFLLWRKGGQLHGRLDALERELDKAATKTAKP
jgi:hypothetical protein